MICFSPGLAALKKDGAWELATLSFPDHWHLAPSFTRRVSLAVSFPTLRWSARTIAIPSGPVAEPASNVSITSLLGETSQPGRYTLASVLSPDPVQMRLRTSASFATSARSASVTRCEQRCVTIVCLAPRVLSLTPQVAFPFSVGRLYSFWGEPPKVRILSRSRGHRRPPSAFRRFVQSAMFHSPFSPSGCDTGLMQRRFVRSKPPGSGSPHWLTVTTFSRWFD